MSAAVPAVPPRSRSRSSAVTARRLRAALLAVAACALAGAASAASAMVPTVLRAVPPAVPAEAAVPTRLRATNYPDLVVRAIDGHGFIAAPQGLGDALFVTRPGLANPSCLSFEAKTAPGRFLRHQGYRLKLHPYDGSGLYRADATWCPEPGLAGVGVTLRSLNYPGHVLRHRNFELWIDPVDPYDPVLRADATFVPESPR